MGNSHFQRTGKMSWMMMIVLKGKRRSFSKGKRRNLMMMTQKKVVPMGNQPAKRPRPNKIIAVSRHLKYFDASSDRQHSQECSQAVMRDRWQVSVVPMCGIRCKHLMHILLQATMLVKPESMNRTCFG